MSTSPPIEKHFRAALLLKQHNEPVEHQNFPRTVRWMPIRWVSASQGARWAALFTMCLILPGALAYIGCKDESGNAVDWWVIYKMPAVKKNATNSFATGYRYAYMDARQSNNLVPTRNSLDTFLSGALGTTLNQIYKNKSVGYIMWNDESPDGRGSDSRGHTKGVMGFTTDGAFLLRHSVPRFPAYRKDGYKGYPEFAHLYGQTMICVSVQLETLSELASQYLLNAPFVYDAFVPNVIAAKFSNISMMAQGMTASSSISSVLTYRSRGGQTFYDFAKTKKCDCELYSDIVAPYLTTGLRTLTWGRPLMGSYCRPKPKFDVTNVMNITWGVSADGLGYGETKEHSKWAVSSDKVNWACIGDINRMESQADRGGGTTCVYMPGLWKSLKNLIGFEQTCKVRESRQETQDISLPQ